MTQLVLSLFLAVLAGLAWYFARWTEERPISLWLWGWGFLVASGACAFFGESVSWAEPLMHLLAPFLPALLLAGALAHANVPVPRWLIPATVALGTFRWGLAHEGLVPAAHAVALVFEPAAELAAAWVVFGFVRGRPASTAERLLAPAFLAVALLDGSSAVWGFWHPQGQPPLALAWALVGTPVVAIQITVALERVRERGRRRQRHVERALSDSEERFRALTENAFDLIAETRPDGRITYANPRFGEVLGCAADSLVGTWFGGRVHPDDREATGRWHRALVEGGSPPPILARWRHQGGEWRWIESAGRAFRAADGTPHVVVCCCDVTERTRMEEELRQARAEEERRRLQDHLREVQRLESLGVLAGHVAHDFSNLLTVILGNSSSARQALPPGSPLEPRLARIHAAARHAAGLVDQMLTYAGKASVKLNPVHLSHLVQEILELLQVSSSRNATLETRLAEHLPLVWGDATQLRQVIVNLITNASEALGGRPGTISVRTGVLRADRSYLADAFGGAQPPEAEYVYLEVADSGSGMDASTRARIFEPFFTTKVSGRGLGLAVVLGIVQGHRGAVKLTSTPGRGTTFRVLLPVGAEAAEAAGERPSAPPAPGGGTVLVVDDDEAVLELAREFLQRAGFRVLAACGGREALEIFRSRAAQIDAVVLDLVMPELDGNETCQAIRRIRADVPLVLATGYGEEGALERFPVGGARALLRKPYEPEELVESVRACLAPA